MELAVKMMVYKEARGCVDEIKSNFNNVRARILDLYEREGWSALGYASWRECVTKEFKQSQAYLYRQLEAAQTAKNISPIGEKDIPESQLRPLTPLPPDQQREVWKEAVETAPEGKVTAAHVYKIVKDRAEGEQQRQPIKEDSINLSNLKTMWNACNAADKVRFMKWLKEYFNKYIKGAGK